MESGGSSSSSSSYRSGMMKVADPPLNPISASQFLVDAASPCSSLNKLSSVGCSKLNLTAEDCHRKNYCMPCIGKWVSDVSEMENFNVSNLITYLRTEFQSVHFKKTEEKLRLLEEEEERKHVESLEHELRAVKDKCIELSLKLWKSESSKTDVDVDLKNCKVNCEELREKVGKLEKVLADKDEELVQLKTSYRDLEDVKKPEKASLELELEPDICLGHYLQQFRNASKMKVEEKLKTKPKSKALVEIQASDSPGHQKRSRKTGGGERKKRNKTNNQGLDQPVDVKSMDKDTEEALAAKSDILEETKKKKKNNSEALGKEGLESNEGEVGEAVEVKVEFLDTPCNEKSSCEILGAKMDKGLSSTRVNALGSGSCHQCKRVNRGKIMTCTNCKRRYCLLCIQKRYPQLSHGEIEKSCPACQGICNCSACLRKSGIGKAKLGSQQEGT